MQYYKHLDGIRAIAVLLVYLLHANAAYMPSGQMGVTLFFVLSGFLISLKIFRPEPFNYYLFIEKRIKRILPAFFAVLIISLILSIWLLDDYERKINTEIGLFSLLISANFYLNWFGSLDITVVPLLHYWSLSVEEQFYFIVIPALYLIYKLVNQKLFFLLVLLLTIISFSLSFYFLINQDLYSAYYPTYSRLGELLVGVIGAQLKNLNLVSKLKSDTLNLISTCSFGFIVIGAISINASIYPALSASIISIATIAIILNDRPYCINKLLANKSISYFGKISYSFYLIHAALLVFYRKFFEIPILNFSHVLIVFVVSLILSHFSYQYIEEKFRYREFHFKHTLLYYLVIPAAITLAIIGYILFKVRHLYL